MSDFSMTDLSWTCQLVADVAQAEIMSRFERLEDGDVLQKSSAFDVVTEADERAESAITVALQARFPRAEVIGEEACHRDPGLLGRIEHAELAFIVDPLDGTKNFASGLPLFGVMLAVTAAGRVIASLIHDPVRGCTAYAFSGGGAWLQRGVRPPVRLRVAAPVDLPQMQGIVGTNFLPEPMRTEVNSRLSRLGITAWFRCAAHEYVLAASGAVHLLFYNRLMPWDHAAGWLLHQEAGGYSAHFDGSPYQPFHTSGGLICAPDEASVAALRRALLTDATTLTSPS